MNEEIQHRKVGRRRLLRRAGTVAAGVAGAGVAGAIVATPAHAASGSFDSNSLTAAGVSTTNTATVSEGGLVGIGPQLRLVPTTGDLITKQAPVGSIAMDGDGYIWATTPQGTSSTVRQFLFHTGNSSSIWPIAPVRILDSRTAAGRAHVLNPTGIFQTNGKLKAGQWLHLDLTSQVQYGYAVIGGIQAADPAGSGYMTVVPYASVDYSAPVQTSNLLYNQGAYIMNMAFCGLMDGLGSTDVISIYSLQDSWVLFDIYGFVVDGLGRINPASLPGAQAESAQSPAVQRRAFVAQQAPVR